MEKLVSNTIQPHEVDRIKINQIVPVDQTSFFIFHEIEFTRLISTDEAHENGLIAPPPRPTGLKIAIGGRKSNSVEIQWKDYAKSTADNNGDGYNHSLYEYRVRS